MIPLVHDFTNATVLVFGGGPVGARKARRFATEADVVVVSPEFADRDFGEARRVRAAPEPGDVPGWLERTDPALVVAATNVEGLNERIATEAQDRGILVNRADQSGERSPGSVVVPATVREDPVVVSISTGGSSPALSKRLRQELEEALAGAGQMAELTGELRQELQSAAVPPDERREIVTEVVSSEQVWTALRTGGTNPAQVIEDVLCEYRPAGGDHR